MRQGCLRQPHGHSSRATWFGASSSQPAPPSPTQPIGENSTPHGHLVIGHLNADDLRHLSVRATRICLLCLSIGDPEADDKHAHFRGILQLLLLTLIPAKAPNHTFLSEAPTPDLPRSCLNLVVPSGQKHFTGTHWM